ncbi:ThiF family adenylyltransferase [Citricoccus sp. K5]|uniref:ThiF family adenylyltransferase n=1 Tax=Citricoccus sp. K5 TaxID=2653135 RepID=UPI0012F2E6F1|nr:ThiF family adenylyltransferase [Citricoccus sp. K5]VXB53150.1 Bacteriocin biosynthesis cyclodehydratase domain-containing protein [Citricoccus sp. K5]
MRLDPGLTLLQIADDIVQIGSGTRSTQLSGCPAPAVEYLQRLVDGIPDGQEAATARRCGLDPADARDLEATLEDFLRWHDPPARAGAGHAADLLADDLALALALDAAPAGTAGTGDADGIHGVPGNRGTDALERVSEVLDRRQDIQIQILGLGRTGSVIARVLAAAGIGRLAVWDPQTVKAADLGTAYLAPDLGRSRPVALGRRVDDAGLGTVVLPLTSPVRPGPGGALTVSVTRGAVDYDVIALARAADHPVLPVVMRDDDALIGPWFVPGQGRCPLCWDLAARDADPERSRRTAALLEHRAGREDVAVATTAGALAARQVIRWAETGTAPAGAVLHVHGDGSRVDTLTVATHPECGCTASG